MTYNLNNISYMAGGEESLPYIDAATIQLIDKANFPINENDPISLLRRLYSIYSPSEYEVGMIYYVVSYLIQKGMDVSLDAMGNIYTKNKIAGNNRILLNAHMDTVGSGWPESSIATIKQPAGQPDDILIRSSNGILLGGDDKNGVAMCLMQITSDSQLPLSALFTVSEEAGCEGSEFAMRHHSAFFDDVIFCLTIDRMGKNDIIISNCDVDLCSQKFVDLLTDIGSTIGMTTENGSISDVSNIVSALHINGINLSSGYYNAHSSAEYTNINHFLEIYKNIPFLCNGILNYILDNPEHVTYKPTKSWSLPFLNDKYMYDTDLYTYTASKEKIYNKNNYRKSKKLLKPLLKYPLMDLRIKLDKLVMNIYDSDNVDMLWITSISDTFFKISRSKKTIQLDAQLISGEWKALHKYIDISEGRKNNDIFTIIPIKQLMECDV